MFSHKIDLNVPYTLEVSSSWFHLLENKLQNYICFIKQPSLGLRGLEFGSSYREPCGHSGCEKVKGARQMLHFKIRLQLPHPFQISHCLLVLASWKCSRDITVVSNWCCLVLIPPCFPCHTVSRPVFLNFLSPATPENHSFRTYGIPWIVIILYECCVSPGKLSVRRKDGPYLCPQCLIFADNNHQ